MLGGRIDTEAISLRMPATDAGQFAVFFSLASVSACNGGICDIFAEEWSCVESSPAGQACETPGLTLECQSAFCDAGVCSEIFIDECPSL